MDRTERKKGCAKKGGSRLRFIDVESTPYFRLLASISVLGGRGGGGWWAWEHSTGREEVGGLEGAVGDKRPDLVNKSAENNSLDFNISEMVSQRK